MRVLSPGNGGSVSQSNNASSNAIAGNANWTGQNAAQSQGSGKDSCCGSGIQAIGQSSHNWQSAGALGITLQLGLRQPCKCQPGSQIGNSSTPTRVLSPGNDGFVRQSNSASSNADGANWNATRQAANQVQTRPDCGCRHGTGIQAIGQEGLSGQNAAALAATLQLGASNAWAPDRKSSPGSWGGDLPERENRRGRPVRKPDSDRPVADPGEKVGDAPDRIGRETRNRRPSLARPAVPTPVIDGFGKDE